MEDGRGEMERERNIWRWWEGEFVGVANLSGSGQGVSHGGVPYISDVAAESLMHNRHADRNVL